MMTSRGVRQRSYLNANENGGVIVVDDDNEITSSKGKSNFDDDISRKRKQSARKISSNRVVMMMGSVLILVMALGLVTMSLKKSGAFSRRKRYRNPFSRRLNHNKNEWNKKVTTPCPLEFRRTFFMEDERINQPISRALRMQGWTKTDDQYSAQTVFSYSAKRSWFPNLKPYQRYNHIPNHRSWNQKDSFITGMMEYQQKTNKQLYSIPDTYRLEFETERQRFANALKHQGGVNSPWVLKEPTVNQGRGITMLGPNTPELNGVLERENVQDYIIQKYVCNEMTIDQRKFDFRVFWLVASLDPLIVFYHDGYLRIGNSKYNEQDFSNTVNHLTTHTGLASEGKATWQDFTRKIEINAKAYNLRIADPVEHVRSQVKQAIGEMVAAFRDVTFNTKEMPAENGFGFYGADFVIDNDLDVWFIEPQHGCGLDEDHMFRVLMHNDLFTEMIDIVEEITLKQEAGEVVNSGLKNLGGYEYVYNDGWIYEYDGYHRSNSKKGCSLPSDRRRNAQKEENNKVQVNKDHDEVEKGELKKTKEEKEENKEEEGDEDEETDEDEEEESNNKDEEEQAEHNGDYTATKSNAKKHRIKHFVYRNEQGELIDPPIGYKMVFKNLKGEEIDPSQI